jgi:predicted HAD superfamily Cof-like phosphohydrolase
MSSIEAQVRQFNTTYGKAMSDKPRLPTEPEANLMHSLILEELMELNQAIDDKNMIEVADALADIIYVAAQQATVIGMPVDALLREVQRSNLSKLGENGKPIYRGDGKVLKGPNFSEPDITSVLLAYCKERT